MTYTPTTLRCWKLRLRICAVGSFSMYIPFRSGSKITEPQKKEFALGLNPIPKPQTTRHSPVLILKNIEIYRSELMVQSSVKPLP